MARLRDNYTRYPRPILWLVRGGSLGEQIVESFYVCKRPVTNRQFEAFAPDLVRSALAPDDDDPATGITFDQARGYADWYAGVSRKPMRLLTEVEWEYACGPDAANAFGLLGMLGGVWEWSRGADGGGILCGGSSRTPLAELSPTLRRAVVPGTHVENAGFRIARSLQ